MDKARYQSTYDQYSGITTLTILNLCDEDEGEYTCTALNSQGEVSTSASLLSKGIVYGVNKDFSIQYRGWVRDLRLTDHLQYLPHTILSG